MVPWNNRFENVCLSFMSLLSQINRQAGAMVQDVAGLFFSGVGLIPERVESDEWPQGLATAATFLRNSALGTKLRRRSHSPGVTRYTLRCNTTSITKVWFWHKSMTCVGRSKNIKIGEADFVKLIGQTRAGYKVPLITNKLLNQSYQ